ncbi:hypothetical protein [Hydrogenimonas sp.]
MRWLIAAMTVTILLALAGHALWLILAYGATPAQILQRIAGEEEAFIDPLPFAELLLQAHTDLFFALMSLALLAAVYIRFTKESPVTAAAVTTLFASALLAPIALLMVPLAGMAAVLLWIAASGLWHLLALHMGISSLLALGRSR